MSCGIGCRCGLDPTLLWLWCRPVAAAAALIRPLAWELPYAMGVALKRRKEGRKGEKEGGGRKEGRKGGREGGRKEGRKGRKEGPMLIENYLLHVQKVGCVQENKLVA